MASTFLDITVVWYCQGDKRDDHVAKMFAAVDTNHDGTISYVSLINFFRPLSHVRLQLRMKLH